MSHRLKPLIAYFLILTFLCSLLIIGTLQLGKKGMYLAQVYMLTPAIAAIITRVFFYPSKFNDALLKPVKFRYFIEYWGRSVFIVILSYIIFYSIGAIHWDFSGQTFLKNLEIQFQTEGKDMYDSLPNGITPKMMMYLMMIGQLTILNIIPGIITGMGEEFGHRGFMYTELKKQHLWFSLIGGGLIWFAWHVPLQFALPFKSNFTPTETIINYFLMALGSVCTHLYFSYVLEKTKCIWVVSLAHIVINNVSAAFSYFAVIDNQLLANTGLTITMIIVICLGPLQYFIRISKKMTANPNIKDDIF